MAKCQNSTLEDDNSYTDKLVGMRLVISRLAESVPDLILFVNDIQRKPDTYTGKHKNGPLPPERVDCHALSIKISLKIRSLSRVTYKEEPPQ